MLSETSPSVESEMETARNFMSCLILFVFLSSVAFAHATQSPQTHVSDWSKLCPYINFCKRNASNVIMQKGKIPCCQPCSCESNCWAKGNCCPDKEVPANKLPVEICEPTLVKRNIFGKNTNGLGEIGRFYITKSCPDTMKNTTLVKMCEKTLQISFEEFIWVTDNVNNKIYQNKFCAECHGIVDYTNWHLSTSCTDIFLGSFNSKNVSQFPEHCDLVIVPTNHKKVAVNYCLRPDIAECNVTGKWQYYDKTVEEACHTYKQYYLVQESVFTRIYENIFCFLCNAADNDATVDICKAWSPLTRTNADTFSAILNFDVSDQRNGNACDVDEIEDPFLKVL